MRKMGGGRLQGGAAPLQPTVQCRSGGELPVTWVGNCCRKRPETKLRAGRQGLQRWGTREACGGTGGARWMGIGWRPLRAPCGRPVYSPRSEEEDQSDLSRGRAQCRREPLASRSQAAGGIEGGAGARAMAPFGWHLVPAAFPPPPSLLGAVSDRAAQVAVERVTQSSEPDTSHGARAGGNRRRRGGLRPFRSVRVKMVPYKSRNKN